MPTIVTVGPGPGRRHDRGPRPGDRRAPGGAGRRGRRPACWPPSGAEPGGRTAPSAAVWHNGRSNTAIAALSPLPTVSMAPPRRTPTRRSGEQPIQRSRSTPPTVATKIKLMRLGKMRAPYYRIVVADARTKRDGRSIETIGKYHPKEDPSFIEVDSERAQYWLGVGAQPTEAVAAIFRVTGDWQKFKGEAAPPPMRVAEPKPDKKAIYEAAVRAGMDEPTADATTPRRRLRRRRPPPRLRLLRPPAAEDPRPPSARRRGARGRRRRGRRGPGRDARRVRRARRSARAPGQGHRRPPRGRDGRPAHQPPWQDPRGPGPPRRPRQGHRPRRPHRQGAAPGDDRRRRTGLRVDVVDTDGR